jgi:hypothetical protein
LNVLEKPDTWAAEARVVEQGPGCPGRPAPRFSNTF